MLDTQFVIPLFALVEDERIDGNYKVSIREKMTIGGMPDVARCNYIFSQRVCCRMRPLTNLILLLIYHSASFERGYGWLYCEF